jgi:hypothetical protein
MEIAANEEHLIITYVFSHHQFGDENGPPDAASPGMAAPKMILRKMASGR